MFGIGLTTTFLTLGKKNMIGPSETAVNIVVACGTPEVGSPTVAALTAEAGPVWKPGGEEVGASAVFGWEDGGVSSSSVARGGFTVSCRGENREIFP